MKLADFGVAAKMGELEQQAEGNLRGVNVAGTPYWMAPEVTTRPPEQALGTWEHSLGSWGAGGHALNLAG